MLTVTNINNGKLNYYFTTSHYAHFMQFNIDIFPHTGWLERTALMSFAPYVLGNISTAFLALSVGGNISTITA